MGVWIPWLVDAARLTGYPVVEVPGWRQRGHAPMRAVECVVGHHTADGPSGEYPSLRIVTDGRGDLAGPLSQLGLGRSGAIYVIAAGLSYHAGASAWAGFLDLNDEAIGIEAESVGTRDDWTAAQRDCYPRLVAALLFYMRRGADRFAGHREVCLPPGRKSDPAFWNMNDFRDHIGWLLTDPLHRIPLFATPPTTRGENMIETHRVRGTDNLRLICPTGKASLITARAWISATVDGPEPGRMAVFFQSDTGGISDVRWEIGFRAGRSDRRWAEVPDGATQINVEHALAGDGTVTLEMLSK